MIPFREFFEKKHGFALPLPDREGIFDVLHRLVDTMADWMDELAKSVPTAAEINPKYGPLLPRPVYAEGLDIAHVRKIVAELNLKHGPTLVDASDFINKPYANMTDPELRLAHAYWSDQCKSAPGWSSAYFNATQVRDATAESDRRGLGLVNEHKIKLG